MEILKRVLAIVVIVISAVFIVLCVVGVIFSWSFNTPLTEGITKGLTGFENVLVAADSGLDRVNTILVEAQTAVDTIDSSVQTAGDTISETSIVYEILDRTVGDVLSPKVTSALETIDVVRGIFVSFNGLLETLNEIPLVEVPTLTEQLDTAADQLASVQNDVEETKNELRLIKQEAVDKPVTAITDRTTRISNGLESAQTPVTNTQNNIDDILTSIAGVKVSVPGAIDLASIVISLAFVWIAFGQLGLIVLAWGYLKGPGSPEGANDDNGTQDEEE
jgi:archaellum component FlaC